MAQKSKSKESSAPKICTGDVINSKVTFEAEPIYSQAAKEVRAEGEVIVMVRVDEEGNVYEATACSGHKLLRQSAVDAAYQTKIAPTKLSGKAFKVGGILLYRFKIEEGKGKLVEIKRAQQIIGREGETASLLKLTLFPRSCADSVSPHVNSTVGLLSWF